MRTRAIVWIRENYFSGKLDFNGLPRSEVFLQPAATFDKSSPFRNFPSKRPYIAYFMAQDIIRDTKILNIGI